MKTKPNICVVTCPQPEAGVVPLSNLIEILSEVTNSLFLITGNEGKRILKTHPEVQGYSIHYRSQTSNLAKIGAHLILQIKIASRVLRTNGKVDIYLFFLGESLILPFWACKVGGKPVILSLAGSVKKIGEKLQVPFSRLAALMETSNYRFADKIVVYSPRLIEEWGLQNSRDKILVAHEHFIDINTFSIKKSINERPFSIGYIGRFSAEKGILNFTKSLPSILEIKTDFRCLIGGDGDLKDQMEQLIHDYILRKTITLTGWIPHDELSNYLNEIKLLVIPSYTEGLPNMMLEAMACGTVVLASPVGAISDLIKEGETGFLLDNNSPDAIVKNVIRVFDHPNLEKIAYNARCLIESEFHFERACEKYDDVLRILRK